MKRATIGKIANMYIIKVDGHEYNPLTKAEIEGDNDLPDEVAAWAKDMLSTDSEHKWKPWPRGKKL